jgi:hypothetical protein
LIGAIEEDSTEKEKHNLFARRLLMFWIFSQYEALGLNFFETKLLAFDWFSDFFPISKNKQNILLELLNMVVNSTKSNSTQLPEKESSSKSVLFLKNPANCELIMKHLSTSFSTPFTKILNDSVENKLMSSQNVSFVSRFAREIQVCFDFFYSINSDKLYSKEIAWFIKCICSAPSWSSGSFVNHTKVLLFERLDFLLNNSKVFTLGSLFEFAKMVFSENQDSDYQKPGFSQEFLSEVFEYCLEKLKMYQADKMAAGLAKEIFDFISLIAKLKDYSKLLKIIQIFMLKFSMIDLTGKEKAPATYTSEKGRFYINIIS